MRKVLILGGYGNFGKRISMALSKSGINIIIAGRDGKKAQALTKEINKINGREVAESTILDVKRDFLTELQKLNPYIVINTVGPFQGSDYSIAESCIKAKVHYIDLSDGRDFVVNIQKLNDEAQANNVAIISGASTVPALSSAVLEKYKEEFSEINSLNYGISPGQKAERGLATTKAILGYVGKELKPHYGGKKIRYGWQDIYKQYYPGIGKRWMANCDIPDLDLLPQKYSIKEINFSAGMESTMLHLGIWLLSWFVRLKIMPFKLEKHASFLLSMSHLFDVLGTDEGGMHMIIKGKDKENKAKTLEWFIIAKDGHGPHIPTIPAIILAKKLISDSFAFRGAAPCLAMVSLEEYLLELEDFAVDSYVFNK